MSKAMDLDPNAIWEEALRDGTPDAANIISRALQAAEARGVERAAKIAEGAFASQESAFSIPSLIRAKAAEIEQ